MALEQQNNIDNAKNQVSDQQITEMFDNFDKSEDKSEQELSKFGKDLQTNLKNKEWIPDKNDELVAWLSIMKEIKDPKQQELAMQILTKVSLSAKCFTNKVDWVSFLQAYVQKVGSYEWLIGEKISLMQKTKGINDMEWKLKDLHKTRVWKPLTAPTTFDPAKTLKTLSTTESPETETTTPLTPEQLKQRNKERVKILIADAEKSRQKLLENPDYAKKLQVPKKEKWQNELVKQFWFANIAEAEKSSQYQSLKQAWMWFGQFLSFLQTKSVAKTDPDVNRSDFAEFEQNADNINLPELQNKRRTDFWK